MYEVEPELRGVPPRRVRYAPRLQATRISLALFFGIPPILFAWLMIASLRDMQTLVQQGVPATATITDKSTTRSKSTNYYLHYVFTDARGVEHQGEESVNEDAYSAAALGDRKQITYAIEHPEVHVIGPVNAARMRSLEGGYALVFLMILVIFGWPIIYLGRFWGAKLHLLANGEAVIADITELKVRGAYRTTGPYLVEYTYSVPTGGDYTRRSPLSLGAGRSLEGKSQATVIVDPKDPAESALYADLRRSVRIAE